MARITVCASFAALHGTQEPRKSTFDVEVTLAGTLQGDFVAGRDDRQLSDRVKEELSFLEGKWLDDIVGRATLENIAAYLVARLRDEGIDCVVLALGKTKVLVNVNDIAPDTYESELAFKRGVSLLVRGKAEEALAAFTAATRLNPGDARAFNARGRCLRKLRRPADAFADYQRAITLDPTFGEAYRNRANALMDLDRVEDALADFDRAISLMPRLALAYNNRGFAYQRVGAFEKALADHERAIELDPTYEEAFRDRGAALMKLGKNDLAKRDIANAENVKGSHNEIDIERAKLMGQVCQLADRGLSPSQTESSCENGVMPPVA
jgi:tetratricopeptide (TPR) repeat protein